MEGVGVLRLGLILTTSKVISRWALIVHTHGDFIVKAAPLENQAIGTMNQYPTQSHYPATELTSPCPLLLVPEPDQEATSMNFISHWF